MKVLHIWNTAGVASLMSKHLRMKGHISDVTMRTGYDPFGMAEYYGDNLVNLGGKAFIDNSIKLAEKYNVIHVHGIWQIIPRLKKEYPNKKIILQHHGTELTRCEDNQSRIDTYKHCHAILCSTGDLSEQLKYEAVDHVVLENAVDTDLFKPEKNKTNKYKPALMFNIRYVDTDLVKQFVRANTDWDLHVVNREQKYVMYSEMPQLLHKYDKYVDVKIYEWLNNKPGEAFSKTGREALACGLKVLNYKGEIVEGLPEEYTPKYMVEKLINIYK